MCGLYMISPVLFLLHFNEESLTTFTNINIQSTLPVYVQIQNEIQFVIESGKFKAGDRLPSAMGLAG